MRIKSIKIVLLVSLTLYFTEIQAQFKVEAELRPRFELSDGYKKLLADDEVTAVYISQRTRLCFSYESEMLKLVFTPQDVRIWGDEQSDSPVGVYGDDASLEMFEGYAELKFKKPFSVSAGRQKLVYDNERLLTLKNWNQSSITYDAALFKFEGEKWKIHAGSSWNSLEASASDFYYPSRRIKSLNYLWLNRKINKNLSFSLMHIASGITKSDSSNTIYFKQTSGLYSKYSSDKMKIEGDIYYQYGMNNTGNPVSALLFDLEPSYKTRYVTFGPGISYLSGNKNTVNTDNLFDLLYGARHKFFGLMDYFTNFPSNTEGGGLCDFYAFISVKLFKNVDLINTSHYFQLAEINENTPDDKNLGFENDLTLNYNYIDWASFKFGYSFFSPTRSLELIHGTTDNLSNFMYIELTIKPVIFKEK